MVLASEGLRSNQSTSHSLHTLLHEALHVGVAELGLGLPLELRVGQLDRDDRGESLADVLAGELLVALEELLVRAVLVDDAGQRRAETLLVRAALVGIDRVGERVDALAVRLVPLHRDLERHAVTVGAELDHRLVDRGLAGVEVADEVGDATLVAEDDLADFSSSARPRSSRRTIVRPAVEEGHLLQPAVDGLEVVSRWSRRSWGRPRMRRSCRTCGSARPCPAGRAWS